jgi:hypothetical protein
MYMITANVICLILGWVALLSSWLWRNKTDTDKEITIKLILSALSSGIFLANIIHKLVS